MLGPTIWAYFAQNSQLVNSSHFSWSYSDTMTNAALEALASSSSIQKSVCWPSYDHPIIFRHDIAHVSKRNLPKHSRWYQQYQVVLRAENVVWFIRYIPTARNGRMSPKGLDRTAADGNHRYGNPIRSWVAACSIVFIAVVGAHFALGHPFAISTSEEPCRLR